MAQDCSSDIVLGIRIAYGILIGLFALLCFGFIAYQILTKGAKCFTKFTILAFIFPFGTLFSCIGFYTTKVQQFCGLEVDLFSWALVNYGSIVSTSAYLLFLYIRSQALLTERVKVYLFRVIVYTVFHQFVYATIAMIMPIYNESTTPTSLLILFSVLGSINGLLVVALDVAFLHYFIKQLKEQKAGFSSWVGRIQGDNALLLVAAYGTRGGVIAFIVAIVNIISLVLTTVHQDVAAQITYYIIYVDVWILCYNVVAMKWAVDRVSGSNDELGEISESFETAQKRNVAIKVLTSLGNIQAI